MYVSEDKFEFLERWKDKGESYDFDDLSDCFDAFFSAFVIYNYLYNLIAYASTDKMSSMGDRNKATQVAPRFLCASVIAEDTEIRSNIDDVKELLTPDRFYIRSRESEWDHEQIKKLSSDDSDQYCEGVLGILYGIRCNIFHGEKPVEEPQKQILIPCVKIMRRLNDLMIEKLHTNQAG